MVAVYSLALVSIVLALVGAVEELPVEELHADHGEDELEEQVDDEDVEDVLQRDDHAVEHSLQLRHSVDRLQFVVEKRQRNLNKSRQVVPLITFATRFAPGDFILHQNLVSSSP